jgi:hypothetical protein
VPAAGLYFHASKSAHGHYAVQFMTGCLTTGCRHTSEVSTDVQVGKPGKTSGRCPSGTFAIPSAQVKRGSFKGSGAFLIAGRTVTISITGTFKSATKITGTIVAPNVCGGADRYVAVPGYLSGG